MSTETQNIAQPYATGKGPVETAQMRKLLVRMELVSFVRHPPRTGRFRKSATGDWTRPYSILRADYQPRAIRYCPPHALLRITATPRIIPIVMRNIIVKTLLVIRPIQVSQQRK
jgi:hypothetical protein